MKSMVGGWEADAGDESAKKGLNSFTKMVPAALFVIAATEAELSGMDAAFPGSVILSSDPIDLPGSSSIIAFMNENRRSIPALNMLMSVKELTTIEKSSRMWENAELACCMTPNATLPVKYSGATTIIGSTQVR